MKMNFKEYLKLLFGKCCCCCSDKGDYDAINVNVPTLYEKYDIIRVSEKGIKFKV